MKVGTEQEVGMWKTRWLDAGDAEIVAKRI